jgi:hypothetical protein
MQSQAQNRTMQHMPPAAERPRADNLRIRFLERMAELQAVRLAARRFEVDANSEERWLHLLEHEDALTSQVAVMPVSDHESILDKLQLLEERLVRLYGGIDPTSEEILMLGAIRANIVSMHMSKTS